MQPDQAIRIWTAAHANAWQAAIHEYLDGGYMAWVCGPGAPQVVRHRDSFAHADAAVHLEMGGAGHVCTAACTGWARTYVDAQGNLRPDRRRGPR